MTEIKEAIRLDPARVIDYVDMAENYIDLDQLQDARNTIKGMLPKQSDSADLRIKIYFLDFLESDSAGMGDQLQWAVGKPNVASMVLDLAAETAACTGRVKQSRNFSKTSSRSSAMHAQQKDLAALYDANQALWESLFGHKTEARLQANSALKVSKTPDVLYEAALAFAFVGDELRAQALAEDLNKRFSDNTEVQVNFLPVIYAQIALSHNDPTQAVTALQPATRYELGRSWWHPLASVYVRGESYLAAHRWTEAVAEFQRILDHRGIVANHPFGALAHLQMGRAYAASGDVAKAKLCYKDFLNLWKDADLDVNLLSEAKAEYAKLK